MANKEKKVPGNVEGPYYVDEECIGCGLCESTAPDNFKMSDDGSTAVVYKQPANESEKAACNEALKDCPSEAIGDNG
ncbi:MAG: ferredoxin [Fibrobacter sp.]|jgi:ferredoxin|nr:ferredoxin [Fibrobacter sp.]